MGAPRTIEVSTASYNRASLVTEKAWNTLGHINQSKIKRSYLGREAYQAYTYEAVPLSLTPDRVARVFCTLIRGNCWLARANVITLSFG